MVKLACVGWVVLMTVNLVFAQAKRDTLPNLPDHYTARLVKFRAEQSSSGKILFLGNSITEQGPWRKLLKDSAVVNRGISGDNTFGVMARLDEVVRFKPSKLFLMIGVNDLSKNIPSETIIENIFAIVNRIRSGSPKTTVYVQSILPVNPTVKGFQTRFAKQENVIDINKQLAKYQEALHYTFVDLHSHFTDPKQLLEPKFTGDGLHLNPAGYQHWVAYLKKNKYL
ncbi:MAG TPA: GDSL-type esterase/lipase family protein [Cyclobacteriaceae bacterium]|nr:GDSL-type esterase/lipase family protein [Cyclobacteriaceae bacterium]